MEREVLALKQQVLGAEHPSTLNTAGNLALSLNRQGKYDEAEKMQREVLALRNRVLGAEHRDTLTAAGNLAASLNRQGKQDEAVAMEREVLVVEKRVLGCRASGHVEYRGQSCSIPQSPRKVLAVSKRVLRGSEHPDMLIAAGNLAASLARQGKYDEAEKMEREVLALRKQVLGAEHPDTLSRGRSGCIPRGPRKR